MVSENGRPLPDLKTWLAEDLTQYQAAPYRHLPPVPCRPLSRAELLADEGAHLRGAHRALTEAGNRPRPAALLLAGWFGGFPARLVGATLARTGAGLLLDESTVWQVTERGTPRWVAPGSPRFLVAPGHPWIGEPTVATCPDEAEVTVRTVRALVAFLSPVLDACHHLGARVAHHALWDEVADGLAAGVDGGVEVSEPMRARLREALGVPGAPWRARPRLSTATSELLGEVTWVQKGGCCLAFTNPAPPEAEAPAYCESCRFRDPHDAEVRVLGYLEECRRAADRI